MAGMSVVVRSGGDRDGRAAQELPQVSGEFMWRVPQLAPCDPDDAPAGDCQRPVAGAILLEALAGAVCLVAIELDDEASRGPDEVALVRPDCRCDHVVGLRPRELVVREQREEEQLELALGDGATEFSGGEDLAQRPRASHPSATS